MSEGQQPQRDPKVVEQRYHQFIQLLPVTLAIAGIGPNESGKFLSDDQMEVRARTLKNAYRHARGLLKEILQD